MQVAQKIGSKIVEGLQMEQKPLATTSAERLKKPDWKIGLKGYGDFSIPIFIRGSLQYGYCNDNRRYTAVLRFDRKDLRTLSQTS